MRIGSFFQKVIFLAIVMFGGLFAQQFQWASALTGTITCKAIATDRYGNSFITGNFSGMVNVGITQITSNGGEDIFIAKYSSTGNFLWIKKAGSTLTDRGVSVSVDNSGNCYITGSFEGTATFSTGNVIVSSGRGDIFLAKYDPNGNFLWVKKAGGAAGDGGTAISVNNSGNCYVTGSFEGNATFSNNWLVTSAGKGDIFVAKYDANGSFLWVRKAGGNLGDGGSAISVDNSGNCLVVGSFEGTATFLAPYAVVTSSGMQDIFIAKYDANGIFQGVSTAGGVSKDVANDISRDNNGNFYVTGSFMGTATFGNIEISSSGYGSWSDIFIAKYSPSGGFIWVKQAGGAYEDIGYGIAVDNSGNCCVAGTFRSTATFGSTQVISNGAEDIFTARYSANGNLLWVIKAGATSSDYGYDISTDIAGNCSVTGSFWGNVSFGSIILTNGKGFISKISAVTGIEENPTDIPEELFLSQNYPNPFNPSTIIRFSLSEPGNVVLKVYNSLGETVQTIVNEFRNLGTYEVSFNASGLPSGFYFYEIKSADYTAVRKMLLLK